MTERPDPNSDSQNKRGMWHTPSSENLFEPPRDGGETKGAWRRVDALPENVPQSPTNQGGWHLPKPEDTTFNPGDKVEIGNVPTASTSPSVLRPEDLIAEITGQQMQTTKAARPEDFIIEPKVADDDTAPGDPVAEETVVIDEPTGMSNLEALGALDDDADESINMSEMMALYSLGKDADTGSMGATNIDANDLSPAERLLFNKALEAEGELPDSASVAGEMTQTLSETAQQGIQEGVEDAASYAARQARELEELNRQGEQPQGSGLTPEEEQLAAQFRETRRQVGVLRQRYEQGQIDYQQLQQELQNSTISDPQGNWWMMGYESNEWFKFNNMTNQWEVAQPPVPLDAPSPGTVTGTGAMPQVLDGGSLPVLPNDGGTIDIDEYTRDYDNTEYATAQQQYNNQYGYNPDDTPIPYPDQPSRDPNATLVGGSAYTENLPQGVQPTYQNLDAVDGFDPERTMQSAIDYDDYDQSVGGMMTQPSAGITYPDEMQQQVDTSAPSYEEEKEAPELYDQARREQRDSIVRIAVIGFVLLFGCAAVSVAGFFGYAAYWYNQTVEPYRARIESLANYQPDFQIARVLDAAGNEIMTLTSQDGARDPVNIGDGEDRSEVSKYFLHAVISSEDPTYYENAGLNILSIARAFTQNLQSGAIESGASTITQQIASNLILEDRSQTAQRKATEIAVALEIANTYNKNQVLEIYINEFPFGNQTFGVEAASQLYFNIPASQLNMAQSAMLAGLLPAPESTNPVADRGAAFEAMDVVIRRMFRTGCVTFQHNIPEDERTLCIDNSTVIEGGGIGIDASGNYTGILSLQTAQVESRNYRRPDSDFVYPHFRNLITELIQQEFGPNALYQRGFTIKTTLIPRLQEQAEREIVNGVNSFSLNGVDSGAVLVLDPASGAIRALVGSPDFFDEENAGQVDNTRAWHQPGSSIKTITYTAALSNNYTPATILWDVPSQFDTTGDGVRNYEPRNFDGQYRGPVSVRNALAQSLNIPAVKAWQNIGRESFISTSNVMGITYLNENRDVNLTSALGSSEVRLLDMVEAYGTLAADGVFHQAYAIESITENINGREVAVDLTGTSLDRPEGRQVITPQIAFLMQSILSDDNARAPQFGTNGALSGASFSLPNQNYVAAKTGTSNDARDLWTIGFTNNWVVGVWMGTVDNNPTTGNLTGARAVAPVWNGVMREALRISGGNPGAFENPGGITQQSVCRLTGGLAPNPSDCAGERYTEIFADGRFPPAQGFVQNVLIDSWTGLRANSACPAYQVERQYANINDPFAINWLNTSGASILRSLGIQGTLSAPPAGECQQGQGFPSIDLSYPQHGSTIQESEIFTITGQISASDLQSWELQYAPVGSEQWVNIVQPSNRQIPTAGSILTEWDTRNVPNNTYRLRLYALSQSGGVITREATVQIQNVLPTQTPIPTSVPPTPTTFAAEFNTPIPFDPINPTPTIGGL